MPVRAERESDGVSEYIVNKDKLKNLTTCPIEEVESEVANVSIALVAIAERLDTLNDHLSQIISALESIDHRLDDSNINRDHYFRTANPNKL